MNTITADDWKRMFQRHRNQPMNTYRFRYFLLTDKEPKEHIMDFERGSPISAIDAFHRAMQRKYEPDDYQIKSCGLWYNDDPWGRGAGQMRESFFDLPKTPNPNVKAFEASKPPPQTQTMPFYDEVVNGGITD